MALSPRRRPTGSTGWKSRPARGLAGNSDVGSYAGEAEQEYQLPLSQPVGGAEVDEQAPIEAREACGSQSLEEFREFCVLRAVCGGFQGWSFLVLELNIAGD